MAEILVIDDEHPIRLLVNMLLIKHGHEVMTAESGEEGLIMFKTSNPDLILLDAMMPEISGYET